MDSHLRTVHQNLNSKFKICLLEWAFAILYIVFFAIDEIPFYPKVSTDKDGPNS